MATLATEGEDLPPLKGGGYKYVCVQTNLPEEFQCLLCQLIPREPHQVTCCGRIMCKGCLHELRLNKQEFLCLNCNESLAKRYFKDINTERKIVNLQIYCIHREMGCQWSGTVRDLEEHLSQCAHQIVECTNGCKEPVYPHQLEEHLQDDCPHRLVACPHCHLNDKHKIITGSSHLNVCPELPIECPNKDCQEIIVQRQLEEHREECPKEMVSCIYASVGCRKQLTRENIVLHSHETVHNHLDLATSQITSLQADVEELTFKIIQVQKQYEEIRVCPVNFPTQKLVFKLTSFKAHKNSGKIWYSPGFETSPPGGYKMSLSVACNGFGRSEDNYLSCYICLMTGEYDDTLEWPFQGDVTVELLNQTRDRNHIKQIIKYQKTTPDRFTQRVTDSVYGLGWGKNSYMSHSELYDVSSLLNQYLKDDTLYFRVSVNVYSKSKPWLAGIK